MKQFIVFIYLLILLFIGLNIEMPTQEKKDKQKQIARQISSVDNYCFTGYYDGFGNDANMRTSQNLVQRILPSFQKFPFSTFFNKKIAELLRNIKISKYIFIAKSQVIRFEGPDIIHPFNYFW